jgi:hypothetical protein
MLGLLPVWPRFEAVRRVLALEKIEGEIKHDRLLQDRSFNPAEAGNGAVAAG